MEKVKENHIHILDFLRGFASLAVVVCHYGGLGFFGDNHILTRIFFEGRYGVQVFFVISGFVIPWSLWQSRYQISHFFRFILRRSLRIDPPYWIALAILVFLRIHFNPEANQFDLWRYLSHMIYVTPFTNYEFYDPVFWTLAIEFQYYVLIGLCFAAIMSDRKIYAHLFLSLFLFSSLLPIPIHFFITHYSTLFVIGIATFLFRIERIDRNSFIFYLVAGSLVGYYSNGLASMLSGLFAFACIQFFEFRHPIAAFLGKVSYSLYLTHNIMRIFVFSGFLTARIHLLSQPTPIKFLYFCGGLLAAIGFSYVFHLLIEEPARRFSKRVKV